MSDKVDEPQDGLLFRAQALPTEIELPRDLWPDIENEISQPTTRKGAETSILPLAVAAVLLLGIATGIGYLAAGVFPRQGPESLSLVVASPPPADARFGIHYAMGPAFVQARRDLVFNLDQELARLSPETRQILLENLEKIDAAIDEINQALALEPNNVLLQKLLLSTYSEELQMLSDMDSLTRTLNQRTRI